jgi:hypothetical protein
MIVCRRPDLGGVLAGVSPRILAALPFVSATADRPLIGSGLLMLIAMAVTVRSPAPSMSSMGVKAYAFTFG